MKPAEVIAARSASRGPRAAVEFEQQRAVLEHAVVVDADRHENQVALAVRVEGLDHVVEEPELGRAQLAVHRQPALRKHRLRHAELGRHLHIALQHDAIQRVARIAPHEVSAHRPDQRLQRPDSGPLAYRVGQRDLLRGQEGDQNVIHVAAVVHHEHQRRFGRHGGDSLLVDVADANPIHELGAVLRQPVADAEIDVGIEGRHDLAGVNFDPRHDGGAGDVLGLRLRLHRCLHARVVQQAIDQHSALRQFERRDLDIEPRVDLFDDPVHPAAKIPAHAREQQAIEDRPRREQDEDRQHPHRQRHGLRHALARPRFERCPLRLRIIAGCGLVFVSMAAARHAAVARSHRPIEPEHEATRDSRPGCGPRRGRLRRRVEALAGAGNAEPLPRRIATAAGRARAGSRRVGGHRRDAGLGRPRASGRHRRFGRRRLDQPRLGKPGAPAAIRATGVLPQRRLRERGTGTGGPKLRRANAKPARSDAARRQAGAAGVRPGLHRERRPRIGSLQLLRPQRLRARRGAAPSQPFRMGRLDPSLPPRLRCRAGVRRGSGRARSQVVACRDGHRSGFGVVRRLLFRVGPARPAAHHACRSRARRAWQRHAGVRQSLAVAARAGPRCPRRGGALCLDGTGPRSGPRAERPDGRQLRAVRADDGNAALCRQAVRRSFRAAAARARPRHWAG